MLFRPPFAPFQRRIFDRYLMTIRERFFLLLGYLRHARRQPTGWLKMVTLENMYTSKAGGSALILRRSGYSLSIKIYTDPEGQNIALSLTNVHR